MSDQPGTGAPPRAQAVTVVAGRPASFWLAGAACILLIVGGFAPWATAFGYASLSGTSMHGWREVSAGAIGLVLLALHFWRGKRLPLIAAAALGVLGAVLALATLHDLRANGAVTVLFWQYRYVTPAWGLYVTLVGALALAVCAAASARRGGATRG
jgi:hypothetical protein